MLMTYTLKCHYFQAIRSSTFHSHLKLSKQFDQPTRSCVSSFYTSTQVTSIICHAMRAEKKGPSSIRNWDLEVEVHIYTRKRWELTDTSSISSPVEWNGICQLFNWWVGVSFHPLWLVILWFRHGYLTLISTRTQISWMESRKASSSLLCDEKGRVGNWPNQITRAVYSREESRGWRWM